MLSVKYPKIRKCFVIKYPKIRKCFMMKYPKIRKCLGWMQTRLLDFYEAFQKEAPPFVCAVEFVFSFSMMIVI